MIRGLQMTLGVPEHRIHYGSAARMRIRNTRTQNPLRKRSENENLILSAKTQNSLRKRSEECEFGVPDHRIHYGSAARRLILSGKIQNSLGNRSENAKLECQNAEFTTEAQRECEVGVPEHRIHYGSAARMRSWNARTQNSLRKRSENAKLECQNTEFTTEAQRECELGIPEHRIHYGSAARMRSWRSMVCNFFMSLLWDF